MAATAIMETFINETTEGEQKEIMKRNKINLKRNLQNTVTPTRVLPTPRDDAPEKPSFSGNNKAGFELICQHIKEYHEFTITKVDQRNEDSKNELLREISLMITGNTSILVTALDFIKEMRTQFVSAIEAATENRAAEEGDFKKVMEAMRLQGSMIEEGLRKLVPGNETPGGINHAEIIKAVQHEHQLNEDKVQSFIREMTSTINKTIKDAQLKQTGTGNATGTRQSHGPSRPTLANSAWNNGPPGTGTGTGSGPPPAPFTPFTQLPSTQTPTFTPTPSSSGNGNAQERNQEQEYITVSRPVAAKDGQGNDKTDWVDTLAKKRNKDFKFTKDAEDAFKNEDKKEAALLKARRQIMIYGLPDPPTGDKKTEIGNIRMVADEFGKKWLLDKGFNVQKNDLKNCITQRLWNYGGKTFTGPKPLKVTFNSPEVANKFMYAAKAGGCDGHRKKIKLGKFQNVSTDDPDWPKYFLRPGTTWEERQLIKEKRDERNAHKAGPEYARYKGAKERTTQNTHRVEEADLDDIVFLDENDTGEKETVTASTPGAAPMSGAGLGPLNGGGGEEEVIEPVKSTQDPETEMESSGTDGKLVIGVDDIDSTSQNENESGENVNKEENEDVRKRKLESMSPNNSLERDKHPKKTNSGATSKDPK